MKMVGIYKTIASLIIWPIWFCFFIELRCAIMIVKKTNKKEDVIAILWYESKSSNPLSFSGLILSCDVFYNHKIICLIIIL